MKNKVLRVLLAMFFLALNGVIWANDNTPQNYPHNPSASDDDAVASIDQTLIWLILTAIVVAFYFYSNKKQTEKA